MLVVLSDPRSKPPQNIQFSVTYDKEKQQILKI